MLRRVHQIPDEPKALKESFTARDIRAFLRSDMDMAERSYEGRTPTSTYNSAARYRKNHGLQDRLDVVMRKGHVFLARKGRP